MTVGSTQLTLMFFSRSSAAIVSVTRITALFEAGNAVLSDPEGLGHADLSELARAPQLA